MKINMACMPLFLFAVVSAFVPLKLSPLGKGLISPPRAAALLRPYLPCPSDYRPWRCDLRMLAESNGASSMDELLKAAQAARALLQTSGAPAEGCLTLEGLKQNSGTDALGQQVHQALLAAKYAANIEEDVYTAPEPVFKMLPKSNDRKAHRVAFFGSSPTPPAAVQNLAASGVGFADASHNGVIAVSGADRYRFVNGLCTNKVLDTKPGQVVQSCFTTKTGRTIDLTTIVVLTDSILILCSASRLQSLYESFDALIFPKDNVQIEDLSTALARFQLVGPLAASIASAAPPGETQT